MVRVHPSVQVQAMHAPFPRRTFTFGCGRGHAWAGLGKGLGRGLTFASKLHEGVVGRNRIRLGQESNGAHARLRLRLVGGLRGSWCHLARRGVGYGRRRASGSRRGHKLPWEGSIAAVPRLSNRQIGACDRDLPGAPAWARLIAPRPTRQSHAPRDVRPALPESPSQGREDQRDARFDANPMPAWSLAPADTPSTRAGATGLTTVIPTHF